MFNNNVIQIIKMMSSFTDKAMLRYPITVMNTEAKNISVKIDMSVLDKEEFPELPIYELGQFLSVFGLYSQDRKVEVDGKFLILSDASGSTSTIKISDAEFLKQHDLDPKIFEVTKTVDTVGKFDLSIDDMKRLRRASGVYKTLTDLNFISRDSEFFLELGLNNTFNAKYNSHKMKLQAETSKEFKISLSVENFLKLPLSNYEVFVKYNAKANAYRLFLVSSDIKGVEIILATNV